MRIVQSHIEDKQAAYACHPFFGRIRHDAPLREILPCTELLAFWTMAFQDALRLNAERVADPVLREIVRRHYLEEAGHDRWFLSDAAEIFGSPPDLVRLFGDGHGAAREATYELVAEVLRTTSDHERLLILLVFESTGHVFFEEIAAYFARAGIHHSLKYFAQHHLDVEKEHEVFEEEMAAFITAIKLSPEQRTSACAMVDRAYVAFHRMFDAMEVVAARHAAQADASDGIVLEHRLRLSEKSLSMVA